MSSTSSGIYRICRLQAGVHYLVTCTGKWHVSLSRTWPRDAIKVSGDKFYELHKMTT